MNYVTPAGFRDVLTDEAQQRERITRAVQERFAARGYLPIETPTLEVMDVMRAGGRLAGSPFRFFDARGDLLAMRPDVTLQVARMTATRLAGQPGPFRFRYLQRVFREAEAEMQAKARELTQMGIECIGEEGPEADAEVVGLLAEALDVAGARGYTLALATVGVLRALLEASGAPAWWKEQVLDAYHASNFVELDRLTAPAGAGPAPDAEPGARASVPPVFAAAIRTLPRIRGGRAAIDEVRALVAPLGCEDGLDAFARTYDLLEEAGLGERILVDFSVMSSFDYYTGLVFEAYAPGLGTPLGSGGRYDNMIAAYGESRPAAGFAFFLEQAMAAAAAVPAGCENAPSVPAAPNPCPLRIAVPKGSLNGDTIAALAAAGLDVAGLANPGRQLIIKNPGVEYVIVRPTDAPTFVALGAADCGICGKDSLLEADSDVVELVDLAFGACRFVVAEPAAAAGAADERYRELGSIRVATKYPGITAAHFARQGREVEIVKLHGNIELAPLTGMAERIVDITATGTTLAENDLVVVEEVLSSTARFFANACAFRTDDRIVQLTQALAQAVQAAPQAQDDPAPQAPTKQG
ncbi:ATP phosphoribosyltransferase regulatory subunit [Gordonibacter urolithinfaciens]|uniref:Multifunctional fusion protein n=3 Tax=Gordonibacter urolithinfaciens TaxID=1335613 RepID=A0A6N8IHX8_9ACTN|nr:ATP phosphoribosyltransferase regulatory subunit [Gordonibacter urolithinfaciens]MVM54366.1 ATP phosphoribosyltransferase regulatory subunit [Gordonibacter urolithinfaciens]MVN15437.1 ATP phosphoribosyltransferase regulatory subunit [Gordonibacter urolithinfaciens]MVN38587.1 ATP phosphoribosyltransferase regulatory subunit [Gordonibacter urolithinfaciens]MVN56937.1 ATP phosphoribosyltransferase regulatory subunit [Gordonibacter urolithinfaciens]MVN61316.1 ATP phosphoribosyltransferase regul